MADRPETIATVTDGHREWRLTRWAYDKAPLVAERMDVGYTVEIDGSGALEVDGAVDHGCDPYIPVTVLRMLIDDAKARGLPEWTDSLATSPLTVLDALRDPEVRAERQHIELSNDAAKCLLRVHGPDGAIELRWWHIYCWMKWKPYRLTIADLDSPCRLVPAEGDHG